MKVVTKHISLTVTRICTILVMLSCVQTINAGTTEMTYDAAGNLLTKLTAELKKSISDKGCITYTYDHERLKEVLYPKNLFNRVTYTYGAPNDKHNRSGRIALIEDASGGEAYYYGRMGEVTKTVRTVMASAADIRTYVHGATYDSWNRVRTMTYPDGEVVTYHYNEAGQVESLTSNKQGNESTIVEQIGYDKDGHTVYTKLGNGTETEYTYDDVRQRLQEMNLTASGNDIMRNKYQYDAVDNILGISNDVTPTSNTKLGGASSYSYQYDKLNRLISATGNAKDASYTLNMAYNVMSMPTSKVQTVDSTTTALSYNNRYRYDDEEHPTAPTLIGHEHYTYDANGNPTRVENDSTAAVREMYWDEENRLMVLSDNGKTSRYTYNHAGDRVVKSHGDLEGVYINGAPQGITFHEHDEFTLYPASIISVNKNRFTKHYFIGDKRIASRIGSGQFNNVYGRNGCYVTAGQQDYAERINQIEQQREEYYKELGIPPGVPTMKGAYGDPENTGVGYNTIITELGDHSVPKNWAQYVVKRNPGETPGPPIIWSDPQNPEDAQPGYGFIADDTTEEETFFYHSDHLGSTSYITDQDGNITQYTAYLPYGELLVDEHSSSEELPYKFNGKELDEETGLYYYGARYLNPVASIWYGTDPLMEKYPNVSPYVYCHGNPLKFIDPDGRDTLNINNTNGKWTFNKPILAEGNDVFNIILDGKTEQYSFNTKNKGDVTFLNLDIPNEKSESTLGIYHIHGSDEIGGTGFFVAPGGMASSQIDSRARVPDGDYPMTTPDYNVGRWRLPGLGGKVLKRGIRIHFGGSDPRKWTKGCFVISSGYEIKDGNIRYNPSESRSQVIRFNKILGASKVEYYSVPERKYKPIRAFYKNPLQNTVFVGSRY